MDYTAKILKIDNSHDERVDFWISLNADQSSVFIASIPALEADKTVGELAMWAYHQWELRQSATPPEEV
jgi:hypothetical protein